MTGSRTKRRTIKQELLRQALRHVDKLKDRTALLDMASTRCRAPAKGISILPRITMNPQLVHNIQRSPSNLSWEPRQSEPLIRMSRQRKRAGGMRSRDVSQRIYGKICENCLVNDAYAHSRRASRASSLSYPSSWNLQMVKEEPEPDDDLSPSEVANCNALRRTPYDHRLTQPILHRQAKISTSVQCSLRPKSKLLKKVPLIGIGSAPIKRGVPKPKMRSKSIQSDLDYGVASSPGIMMLSKGVDTKGICAKHRVYSGKADSRSESDCSSCSVCNQNNPTATKPKSKNNGGYTTSDCSCELIDNGRLKSQEKVQSVREPSTDRLGRIERISQPPAVIEKPQRRETNQDKRNRVGIFDKRKSIPRSQCKKNVGFDCSMKNCSCTPNNQSLANVHGNCTAQCSNRGQNVVTPSGRISLPPSRPTNERSEAPCRCTTCQTEEPSSRHASLPKPEQPEQMKQEGFHQQCPTCMRVRSQQSLVTRLPEFVTARDDYVIDADGKCKCSKCLKPIRPQPSIQASKASPYNINCVCDCPACRRQRYQPSSPTRTSSIKPEDIARFSSQTKSEVVSNGKCNRDSAPYIDEGRTSNIYQEGKKSSFAVQSNRDPSVSSQRKSSVAFPDRRSGSSVHGSLSKKYPSEVVLNTTYNKSRDSKYSESNKSRDSKYSNSSESDQEPNPKCDCICANQEGRKSSFAVHSNRDPSVSSQRKSCVAFPDQRSGSSVHGSLSRKYPSEVVLNTTYNKSRDSKYSESNKSRDSKYSDSSGSDQEPNPNSNPKSDCICANCGASINKSSKDSRSRKSNDSNSRKSSEPQDWNRISRHQSKHNITTLKHLTERDSDQEDSQSVAGDLAAETRSSQKSTREESNPQLHCSSESCFKQCGKCKITPAKTKQGEAMVNLVVDDKCNVNQIIEILQETVAGLEKQKQILSQQNPNRNQTSVSQGCASGTTINPSYGMPMTTTMPAANANAQYAALGQHYNQCSCFNTRPGYPVLNYMPYNTFPQQQQYNQQFQQPNVQMVGIPQNFSSSAPRGARARILTKTDYDYEVDGVSAGHCHNTKEPHPTNSRPRSGGITYSFDEESKNCSNPANRHRKRKTLKPTRSFIQIFDMAMALKENRTRLRQEVLNNRCGCPQGRCKVHEFQVTAKTKKFLDLPDHNSYERNILEGLVKKKAAMKLRNGNDSLAQKPRYVAEEEEEYTVPTRAESKQKLSVLECGCRKEGSCRNKSYRQPEDETFERDRSRKYVRNSIQTRTQMRPEEPIPRKSNQMRPEEPREIPRKSYRNTDCSCKNRRQTQERSEEPQRQVQEREVEKHLERKSSTTDVDLRECSSIQSCKQIPNEESEPKKLEYPNMYACDLGSCKRRDLNTTELSTEEAKYYSQMCPCQIAVYKEQPQKKPSKSIFSCCSKRKEKNEDSVSKKSDKESKKSCSISSLFPCMRQKREEKERAKLDQMETKKSKSRSSLFSCCRKKQQQKEDFDVESDAKKPKSKSSLSICKVFQRKKKDDNESESKSKSSGGFSLCKRRNREKTSEHKSEYKSDLSFGCRRNREKKEVEIKPSEESKPKSKSSLFICQRKTSDKKEKEPSTSRSNLCFLTRRRKSDKRVTLQTEKPKRSKSKCFNLFACLHRSKREKKDSETNTSTSRRASKPKLSGLFPCCYKDKKEKKQQSEPEEDCECDEVKVLYDSSYRFSNHSYCEEYENSVGEENESSDCQCVSETDIDSETLKPQTNTGTNNLTCTDRRCM